MDITAFSSDIDELVEAFVEINGLELSQMKELWRSRSFSFIHEAKLPQVNSGFFMQALYSCALEFLKGDLPWSKKFGGLYVLYMLYETQITTPPIKIYLSIDDLENIYSLVLEAKANGPLTALRIVNRMMVRDFFLYGSVSITGKKMKESFRELSSKATERVQNARKRFFASSSATRHFEGNLIKDLGLDELALLNQEYEIVKQRVFKGAAENAEDDFDSIGPLFGDELKKDVHLWMEDRKRFFKKQGEQEVAESQGQETGCGMDAASEKGVSGERQESGQCGESQGQEKGSGMDAESNRGVSGEQQERGQCGELLDQEKASAMDHDTDGGGSHDGFKMELETRLGEDQLGMDRDTKGGGGGGGYEMELETGLGED